MNDPGPSSSSSSLETRLADKKLTLRATDHLTNLQNNLLRQWQQGENCDMVLSSGSSSGSGSDSGSGVSQELRVHSCVVSCFSTKISAHLTQASVSMQQESEPTVYSVAQDGLACSFPLAGKKLVELSSVNEEVLQALVEYMYTGTFSVRYGQALDVLRAARLLDMQFITKVMEIFVARNPDVFHYQTPPALDPGLDCTKSLSHSDDALQNSQAQAAGIAGAGQASKDTERRGRKRQRKPLSGRKRLRRQPPPSSTSTSTSTSQPDDDPQQQVGEGGEGSGGGELSDVSAVVIKSEVVDPDLRELLTFSQEVEGEGETFCPSVANSNQMLSTFDDAVTQLQQDNVVNTTTTGLAVERGTAVTGGGSGVSPRYVVIKQEVVLEDSATTHQDTAYAAQSDSDDTNCQTDPQSFYVDLPAGENTDEHNNDDDDENADDTLEDFHERLLRPASSSSRPKKKKKKKHLGPKALQCRFCGRTNDSKDSLYSHLREEHAEESFLCQQCPCAFLRKEGLTAHVRSVHELLTWTCIHCHQVFSAPSQFSAHCAGEHDDLRPFRCTETASCDFRSKRFSSLDKHRQCVHFAERTVACSNCNKCFPTHHYLRLHQRACLKQQQHLCPECGEVFNLRSYLTSHINNKHGGQRRYVCPQCDRRFSCYANRSRHMRIHNNAFPYVCETCGKKFRHSNTLKDHVKRKHDVTNK